MVDTDDTKKTPEVTPNVIPPDIPPALPEKKDGKEKNIPFHTPPEAKPFHEETLQEKKEDE